MGPRTAHVSEYLLDLAEDTDPSAPGAAITRELCGHWEHVGPCRWPHHTAATAVATTGESVVGEGEHVLRVRTVFVCARSDEAEVRAGIAAGLRVGTHPPAPPGWSVRSSPVPSGLTSDEEELAARLDQT